MSEAKADALEFVSRHKISQLATVEDGKPYIRLMYTPRVDEDLTVWYATSLKSNKVRHIRINPYACTIFTEDMAYVRLSGPAEVVTDDELKAELWEDDWSRYWPEGKTDPDYVLVKITPDEGEMLDMNNPEAGARKII